jgi:endonuclease/exonuclease/phosphatase family metal-dependent hydrolase
MMALRRWASTVTVGLGILLLIPTPGSGKQVTDTLRVLAFNTHHGEGLDGELDLERIGRLIESTRADLVALQEIDRLVERTGFIDQADEYAEHAGLEPLFGAFMSYQGGQYGMALLSGLPILDWANHRLPDGAEPRTALTARVRLPNTAREVVFSGIHFYRTEEERMAQARALTDILADETGIVILAGDFNSLPGSPVMDYLGADFEIVQKRGSAFTFPADEPAREIDFMLVRPGSSFEVLEHRVLDERVASDHRPIFLVLEIR